MLAAQFRMDEALEVEEKVYIIPINMIRGLPFNTSVMEKTVFEALQKDMTSDMASGFERIDPILVRRLTPEEVEEERRAGRNVLFEVVDGHKRLEAAENNKWTHIRARVINVSRDEAILINYRKNKERGEIDEIKESLFFRYLHEDKGMSIQRIAGAFGLTDETVMAALSKAPVSREARMILLGYRKKIPPRLIEVISSAPKEIQGKLAKAFVDGLPISKIEEMRDQLAEKKAAEEPRGEEKVIKPAAPRKPAPERHFPEPVKKASFPEPVKKPLTEPVEVAPSAAPERAVEVSPPRVEARPEAPSGGVQEFSCPGCGRKFRVDWEKRLVEWI